MNEIFPGEHCKNHAIICNVPYILVMHHNIIHAPMSHYDKTTVINYFVMHQAHYDKLTVPCNVSGT